MQTIPIAAESETILNQRHGSPIRLPERVASIAGGLKIKRLFTTDAQHPYDVSPWEKRDVRVMSYAGGKPKVISERLQVEVPSNWDENAVRITVDKYLFGSKPGTPEYEDSLKHAFDRIANTYTVWGFAEGYFADLEDALIFNEEVKHMLVNQMWAPNSPVWFNVGQWEQWRWGRPDLRKKFTGKGNPAYYSKVNPDGVLTTKTALSAYSNPQASACFLTEVGDSMEGILDHLKTEGRVFSSGSGVGINISSLRSSHEPIQGKGKSSGPLSFNRGWDRMAGAIKSGGKTRRAARMVLMYSDHPDIFDFVAAKRKQEDIAKIILRDHNVHVELRALACGKLVEGTIAEKAAARMILALPVANEIQYSPHMDELLYGETLADQNANHSVSLKGDFWKAYNTKGETATRWVTKPDHVQKTYQPSELLRLMAEAVWENGEPGVHNNDWINLWNPVKSNGSISTSNPCCFAGDAKVLTDKGLIAIKDIESDTTKVYTKEGTYQTVLAAWCAGETRTLIKVVVCGSKNGAANEHLELPLCTPEHPFLRMNGSVIRADELKPGMNIPALSIVDGEYSRLAAAGLYFVESIQHVVTEAAVKVYDIEVEHDHSFAVATSDESNLVFVHNSEYLHLNNTSCNLSSVNLYRFFDKATGEFQADKLQHAARLAMICADLNIECGGFPIPEIAEGTYRYRTTGIGYANLGGLLMALGIPYDSDDGRWIASQITSLLTASCWATSAELGRELGSYIEYGKTKKDLHQVLELHRASHLMSTAVGTKQEQAHASLDALYATLKDNLPEAQGLTGRDALEAYLANFDLTTPIGEVARKLVGPANKLATKLWNSNITQVAYRNSFTTCIAPTGTISAPMGIYDQGTTSAEPDYTLVKYKQLSGGGSMKMFNSLALDGLRTQGYGEHLVREAAFEVAGLDGLSIATSNPGKLADHLTWSPVADQMGPVRQAWDRVLQASGSSQSELLRKLEARKWETTLADDEKLILNGSSHVENVPWLKPEHLAAFDCSATNGDGKRSIHYLGHLKMLGAIQPFVSGASSKTVNLPENASVADIEESFVTCHKLGIKCIAVFRAGSKANAVYFVDTPETRKLKAPYIWNHLVAETTGAMADVVAEASKPHQRKLPGRRPGQNVKFTINGQLTGFLTVGIYPDGTCGEVFVRLGQVGSFPSSMVESFCKLFSSSLQSGIPLDDLCDSFRGTSFEPSGFCKVGDDTPDDRCDEIKSCASVVDLMVKMLSWLFPAENDFRLRGMGQGNYVSSNGAGAAVANPLDEVLITVPTNGTAKAKKAAPAGICPKCHSLNYVQDGKCKNCRNCGFKDGGCGE